MSRRKLIAANWKMNKSIAEARAFVDAFRGELGALPDCDIVIIPPFFAVPSVAEALADTDVGVGVQDFYWESSGAFTGEVSTDMATDAGAEWALVGHSERRHVIGETNAMVGRKLTAAIRSSLNPILCVGETIEEREADRAEAVVEEQLATAFAELGPSVAPGVVIAYEPVWAIGTGKTATPADAEAMHGFIRSWFAAGCGEAVADGMRIQYGGSVKPDNAAELLACENIDGALVGGASLDAGSFAGIIKGVSGG